MKWNIVAIRTESNTLNLMLARYKKSFHCNFQSSVVSMCFSSDLKDVHEMKILFIELNHQCRQ